jgi:DNA mismatch endonuclease, patch repair protein
MRSTDSPPATTPGRARNMAAIRSRDTKPELALRHELWRRGHRYLVNASLPVSGIRRRVDMLFRGPKVVVFVDGCFWHLCPDHGAIPARNVDYWQPKLEGNRRRDRETDALLVQAGYSVVRVWEHEPLQSAAATVETALRLAAVAAAPNA